MNSINFRTSARRSAAAVTAALLVAGSAALAGAGPAQATEDQGRASAVVLRTGLDVSLLDKTVTVPLAVSLNEVRAPRSAEQTALTARLDGVDGGEPFTVLRAEVARAAATVTADKAEGTTRLAGARLHVPGLPLLSLIEVESVTSTATCEAGRAPVADSRVIGTVTVLGKRVTLTAGGPTDVKVPGVGEVRLDLSERQTTSRTAAATALRLTVSVDPLDLNVAEVQGTVTLAEATCEAPAAAEEPAESPAAGSGPVSEVRPQGAPAQADLARTGGGTATPYIAGGALALVAAGGGALVLARRRARG
ncbi:SCO1860 family LAETG-anchored protein [Streptomyces cadmiisoli]|uniref:SCO1860 family LAETG-anchored protein n=1 Tax=Streptomyces cadmiisoli TaxID=2184053 RepID=UPI00365E637B